MSDTECLITTLEVLLTQYHVITSLTYCSKVETLQATCHSFRIGSSGLTLSHKEPHGHDSAPGLRIPIHTVVLSGCWEYPSTSIVSRTWNLTSPATPLPCGNLTYLSLRLTVMAVTSHSNHQAIVGNLIYCCLSPLAKPDWPL
jgi:hypothetical protein